MKQYRYPVKTKHNYSVIRTGRTNNYRRKSKSATPDLGCLTAIFLLIFLGILSLGKGIVDLIRFRKE